MSRENSTSAPLTSDASLPDDPEVLKLMIRELLATLQGTRQELDGVRQRLDQLLRRLYGPKSERLRPDQPTLFESLIEPKPETPAILSPSVPKTPATKGHGRKRLPADLRRQRVEHDLADAEKTCPCCQGLRVKIGEETSEQLDYRPAKLFVWEHVRFKYACLTCLKKSISTSADDVKSKSPSTSTMNVNASSLMLTPVSELIVVASKPPQPIDKGLPGPGLLAHVITSK